MAPLPQLTPGTIFARDFRVLRHLSAGGMGAVYVVEQVSTQRQRALKIMLPDIVSDARARERFMQEATVSARIRSDHVVEVVGAGVDDATGTPWLAMELLEGEELAAIAKRRGALPPADVLEIFRQLCHGLGAAHRAGLVHRDLKPENVFMASARREGVAFTVKVLDFGIAKVVGESRTSAMATSAIGSPMWMAPEQADQGQIRPCTDVWALGLIGYYLLTGVYFWHMANTENFVLPALLKEVYIDPIEPASARAARYNRGALLPPHFDAWFARCVVRDPSQRFADANEALAGIIPVLSAIAGAPSPPQTWAQPTPPPTNLLASSGPVYPPNPAMATPPGYGSMPGVPQPMPTQAWSPGATPATPYPPNFTSPPYATAPAPSSSSNLALPIILGVLGVGFLAAVGLVLVFLRSSRTGSDGGVTIATSEGGTTVTPGGWRPPQCRGTGTRTDIPNLTGVTSISAGRFHACSASRDGLVRCWGWNSQRQLGDDTTEDQYTPSLVPSVSGAVQVAAGQSHTCALVQGGMVMCWGLSSRGVRGTPFAVDGLLGVTQISAGELHTCGRRSDGTAWCWGMNHAGQLGDGTTSSPSRAVQVEGLSNVVQVAAGGSHSCALIADGSVWCWGQQEHGQLGNGHRAREPASRPVMVPGVAQAAQIAAGENHSCALLRNGTAMCWGENEYGQAGIERHGIQASPVAVTGLTGAVRIAAGYSHTCALKGDGALWCWGQNLMCQIGPGGFQQPRPATHVDVVGSVVEVAPGGSHTCARRADGTARCWGYNNYGQIANGQTSQQIDIQMQQ